MSVEEIEVKLSRLAKLRAKVDSACEENDREHARITKPIRKQLDALARNFNQKSKELASKILPLEAEIKEAVIEHGESVKGDTLHAVFIRPRVSWDTGKLEGMIAFHPQIAEAKIVAESGMVQIRTIGKKED